MARLSLEEIKTLIIDAIDTAGGEIEHQELMDALSGDLHTSMLTKVPGYISQFKHEGSLDRVCKASAEGPVLLYRLPQPDNQNQDES